MCVIPLLSSYCCQPQTTCHCLVMCLSHAMRLEHSGGMAYFCNNFPHSVNEFVMCILLPIPGLLGCTACHCCPDAAYGMWRPANDRITLVCHSVAASEQATSAHTTLKFHIVPATWLSPCADQSCYALQPWYSRKAASPPPSAEQQAPDDGQDIALTAGTDLLLTDCIVTKHSRHKHKKDKKRQGPEKDTKSSRIKSVIELRAERQAREQAERTRQERLLHVHRGYARPR